MKIFPHPDDSSLVLTPPNPPEERGKRINNLISTITLSAAFGLVAIAIIAAAIFTVRIVAGDYSFQLNISYLGYAILYLAAVVIALIYCSLSLELPPYTPRWLIEKEPGLEDPYDEFKYGENK